MTKVKCVSRAPGRGGLHPIATKVVFAMSLPMLLLIPPTHLVACSAFVVHPPPRGDRPRPHASCVSSSSSVALLRPGGRRCPILIPRRTENVPRATWRRLAQRSSGDGGDSGKGAGGSTGGGRSNWIEKTSPTGTGPDAVDEYSLGIDGYNFRIGPLSSKFYDALTTAAAKRFPGGTVPEELAPVYVATAMDLSAKEATRVALSENGLDMKEDDAAGVGGTSGMPGAWGVVEDVQILDKEEGGGVVGKFDTLQEAAGSGNWEPGTPFSFVVRNVRAELKTVDLKQLLSTLNMEGMMDEVLEEQGEVDDDNDDDDDDDDGGSEAKAAAEEARKAHEKYEAAAKARSLETLARNCEDRSNAVPTRAAAVGFAGGIGKGYDVLTRAELVQALEGSSSVASRVMDALIMHGCLVVDVGEGSDDEMHLWGMWNATDKFFRAVNDEEQKLDLPAMDVAEGAGSRHAVVGYASYADDAMQFLETRVRRDDGAILPVEVAKVVGEEGAKEMALSQGVITDVGKDVVRIAVKEVMEEVIGDRAEQEKVEMDLAPSLAATRLVNALLDDGKKSDELGSVALDSKDDTTVNMSPHRMCRYSDDSSNEASSSSSASATEVFGAHTDTSFVTVVPVAAVSGLEVYDSAARTWIRPELVARRHWENERLEGGRDPSANQGEDGRPWHCRYMVVMPGELLQLVTDDEIPAAVHRVVAMTGGVSRLSAPVLLRARPRARMDLLRYYGNRSDAVVGPLLRDSEDMTMEDIHDRLQPGYS